MSTTPPFLGSDKEDPRVAQLLREARAAIKLGSREAARAKLQEAVALDQYSEQGWWLLASVVETDDERKVCLGNVIVINPDNQRAKAMLDRLNGNPNAGLIVDDARPEKAASTPEPAGKKALPIPLLIGGVVALVVIIGLVVLLAPKDGSPVQELVQTQTALASLLVALPTRTTAAGGSSGNAAATENVVQNTLAPLKERPTLPPTWTAQPTAALASQFGTPLPPPPNTLTGRIALISGKIGSPRGDLPVSLLTLPDGKPSEVTSDFADYAIFSSDGTRLIYSYYVTGTDSQQLRVLNINGGHPRDLAVLWGNIPPLANLRQPSISRKGTTLAFAAENLRENDATADIYVASIKALSSLASGGGEATGPTTSGPDATAATTSGQTPVPAVTATPVPTLPSGAVTKLVRLTDAKSGINTWPAVSPDGSKIAYVSDLRPIGEDTVDIFVLNADGGGKPVNLTNDGLSFIEGAPEYSVDGTLIAFQAAPQGSKKNDIYVMKADGTGKIKITDGVGDNIRPHWSRTDKYLVFSSTRNGKWECYISDIDTKTLYQVTQTSGTTLCTGWIDK